MMIPSGPARPGRREDVNIVGNDTNYEEKRIG